MNFCSMDGQWTLALALNRYNPLGRIPSAGGVSERRGREHRGVTDAEGGSAR